MLCDSASASCRTFYDLTCRSHVYGSYEKFPGKFVTCFYSKLTAKVFHRLDKLNKEIICVLNLLFLTSELNFSEINFVPPKQVGFSNIQKH